MVQDQDPIVQEKMVLDLIGQEDRDQREMERDQEEEAACLEEIQNKDV